MALIIAAAVIATAATAACSSTDSGSIQIVTGPETDTFSRAPAPAQLKVESVDSSGKTTTLATQKLPTTTIDLGSLSESTIASIQVTGLDATGGQRLVFGATLPLIFGGLSGSTIPVFVQRVGELARLPGALGTSRSAPVLSVIQGEYLFAAGGLTPATSIDLYDFAGFGPLSGLPRLPLSPVSAAFVGTTGWLFAADGTAQYFDVGYSTSGAIPSLGGGSFADIAGGATVVGDNGVQYIVGATRTTGTPTAAVLAIDPNDTTNQSYLYGGPTWIALSAPRLGAAATWVPGRGLVVVGGSATASGVEIVQTVGGKMQAVPLAYPPDPSMGMGATALSTETVLVGGGLAPDATDSGVRAIDLACASGCAPVTWAKALGVPLLSAQAFTMDTSRALIVGNEGLTGATHAYVVTSSTMTEVPTKVPHTDARAVWTPVGSIALVGGSPEIETFVF